MINTTTGMMSTTKNHMVSQKITRAREKYGRKIVILDYENEKPVPELEVIIRISGETTYHMPDENGAIDIVFTEKDNEEIMIDVTSFVSEKSKNKGLDDE